MKKKTVDEWGKAFDTIKKVVSESDLDISDSKIENLVYHLGKTGIIGLDLSSTKDYSSFYGTDGLEYVIKND